MINFLEAKVGRRLFLTGATTLAAGLFFPDGNDSGRVSAKELPYVITCHGLGGTPESGFIGDLNSFLAANSIPYTSLVLPGGYNPDREEWRKKISKAIKEAPIPPHLLLYSLSGLPGLEAASDPNVHLDSVTTIAIRKIRPSLPFEFPLNLVDFYRNSQVNIPQLIENTPHGRLVVHSRDDQVVWFDGNAPELAEQIQAKTWFMYGMGHFTQSISQRSFDRIARRVVMA